MTDQSLPTVLENILATHSEPGVVFSALLPALGGVLQCDRSIITQLDSKITPLAVAYVKVVKI